MRRLEQAGAVVLRLERARGPSGHYQFCCELPLPNNPRYHRFFQATAPDPARAVQLVERDVIEWKKRMKR